MGCGSSSPKAEAAPAETAPVDAAPAEAAPAEAAPAEAAKAPEEEDAVAGAFKVYDANGSGGLHFKEFSKFYNEVTGLEADKVTLAKLLAKGDSDGNWQLSLAEVRVLFVKLKAAAGGEADDKAAAGGEAEKADGKAKIVCRQHLLAALDTVGAHWDKYQKDEKQSVDVEDLEEELMEEGIEEHLAEELFDVIDASDNGRVTKEEWNAGVVAYGAKGLQVMAEVGTMIAACGAGLADDADEEKVVNDLIEKLMSANAMKACDAREQPTKKKTMKIRTIAMMAVLAAEAKKRAEEAAAHAAEEEKAAEDAKAAASCQAAAVAAAARAAAEEEVSLKAAEEAAIKAAEEKAAKKAAEEAAAAAAAEEAKRAEEEAAAKAVEEAAKKAVEEAADEAKAEAESAAAKAAEEAAAAKAAWEAAAAKAKADRLAAAAAAVAAEKAKEERARCIKAQIEAAARAAAEAAAALKAKQEAERAAAEEAKEAADEAAAKAAEEAKAARKAAAAAALKKAMFAVKAAALLIAAAAKAKEGAVGELVAEYTELETSLSDLCTNPERKADLKALWKEVDFNDSRSLTFYEIDHFFKKRYPLMVQPRANKTAYKMACKAGDGDDKVERKEFASFLLYAIYCNKIYFVFDELNTGRDKRVGKEEFVAGVGKLGIQLSKEEAEAEFDKADRDGGGQLLFKEFMRWCAEFGLPSLQSIQDDEE